MSGFRSRKRRHENREDIQPVEEVVAELARRDRPLEILVGGRDQADVGADRLGAAEPLELALLEHAQQLDLGGEVQVANLVEEQRAAVGELEPPFLRAWAPVKAPFS